MIRSAKPADIEQCLTMLQAFASASIYDYADWQPEDLNRARTLMLTLIKSGYLVVADNGNMLVGMIGAVKEQDPWIASRSRIRELFWWMEPQYRKTRLSAELYRRWDQDTARWLKEGLVNQVSLSTQPGGSEIGLNKRGWQCVEQHWIKG